MDIERLKKKRQLNVQEQNYLQKHRIESEAVRWRENGIPEALEKFLLAKGINSNEGIFLDYLQDFPGLNTDEGLVLTKAGRFFEFEMDLDEDRTRIISCHVWRDVTSEIEINEHKPGTGSTWGFLALQVLNELAKC